MAAPARLWQMRRIYLDRVGSPAARFRDVWLDLTGRDGRPLDTILWMRNGGGKSTLIALVCALIRPDRRDFLATATTGRHLEDCILGADTGHVVVEWTDPTGRRLVTGAVYEWTDRVQPADPNAGHDRLKQCWYAFTPGPEVESLPFAGADFKEFVRTVEALPATAEAVVTTKQDRWAQALHDRGLDPGLFTAILRINAAEGGIEHHFKFKTSDDFVQYLLSLVTEPTSATKVATILRGTRERLARQPRLRAEIAFCDEAVDLLDVLDRARAAVTTATTEAGAARAAALRLAAAFTGAAAQAAQRAAAHEAEAAAAARAAQDAQARAAGLDVLLREEQWQAASRRHTDALAAVEDAARTVEARRRLHRAWQLVPALTDRDQLTSRLEAARGRQREAEAGAAPLRQARAEAAAVYLSVLRDACAELDDTVETLAAQATDAADQQAKSRALADGLRADLGGLGGRQRAIEQHLAAFDHDLHAAAEAGHLTTAGPAAGGTAGAEAAGGTDGTDEARGTGGAEGAGRAGGADEARGAGGVDGGGAVTVERLAGALAAARGEDDAAARRLAEELPAEAERLDADRAAHERDRAAVHAAVTELTRQLATLDSVRTPLLAEIDALATDPRLTALTERDTVDPVAEHRLLVDQLSEAIISADRQRIQLAVADAEDDRAVQALASPRGLLPAALDLARAADVLAAERIPAVTGWHHLADRVPQDRWAAAVQRVPHLVGGLLLHDEADLPRARDALRRADLFPTSAVQISTTARLDEATRDAAHADGAPRDGARLDEATRGGGGTGGTVRETGFVLEPAPAMFDRTAAAREADRRAGSRRDRGERVEELLDARDHDLRLKDQLRQLADRCPPGHREHLDAEHRRAGELLGEARDRAAQLDAARGDLDARAGRLREAQQRLAERRRILATRLGVLQDLCRRAPEADRQRAELAQLPARRADLERQLEQAEEQERGYAAVAARCTAGAEQHRVTARGHRARIDELRRVADPRPPAPARPVSLAAAMSAYQAADEAYLRRSSGDALEATISEIGRRLDALDRQLRQFSAEEHETAARLAATPEAADPALVARDTELAEQEHFAARAAATRAESERDAARQELAERAAQRPAAGEPALVVHLGQDLREQLELAGETVRAARDRQAAEEQAAQLQHRRAEDFHGLAGDLEADLGERGEAGAAPFDGDVDAAREAGRAARRALQAAEKAFAAARNQLAAEVHRVDRWAGEERFAAVTAEVRDRFRGEHTAELPAEAARGLAGELRTYRHALAGELEAVDKDKHLVVTALCAEVREGLKTLQRAQHHAQLPPGLAEHLRNRRFLDVGPRSTVDTTDATLRSRVERLVERLVARQETIPDGLSLVWEATTAVVGRGNFTARVLKPSTELGEDRQPVELMSKWSGGEKVTISLLLFCMLARLRAANRGGDVPGLGVLPMDNPLGTANYVAFLDLQRRVAAANGIQLVFLSGLGDMRAVGRFPNVVRMRNTHHRGRNYAQVQERELNDEQVIEGITTARLTFPHQETLL
ncbi:hypothetical protein AB0H83_42595 [Dactylosporangium sp. NPDC050688]|uniref:hypothetical protein n=1 Tax=Dactylosporangium sp. NPDC050688 TaxID=3157217 RepID=UPI0033FDB47A